MERLKSLLSSRIGTSPRITTAAVENAKETIILLGGLPWFPVAPFSVDIIRDISARGEP